MLERHNPKPLYAQLSDILREKIEKEGWQPNTAIPSENELSKEYGVSRMTARAVVSEFVREGILYRVPGKGTFVAEPKITTATLTYQGIREQLEQMGYETRTKLLAVKKMVPPKVVLRILDLEDGAEVYMIERLRFIKDEPLSLHTSYVPVATSNGLDTKALEEEQLCVILSNEYGLKRQRVVETLESSLANETEARMLTVKKGSPLLLLKDIISGRDGKPFEYTQISFRGDKIKISFIYNE